MLFVKILGVIDIMTAIVIYMNSSYLFLTVPLFLIHFLKGIASMGADILGKIYGIVDILSAFVILFSLSPNFILSGFLIVILLFKGVTSLL